MPNGRRLSHEAGHLLAGETAGQNPYVSLPNLLAGRELVKELLQDECQPEALAAALDPLLHAGPERNTPADVS